MMWSSGLKDGSVFTLRWTLSTAPGHLSSSRTPTSPAACASSCGGCQHQPPAVGPHLVLALAPHLALHLVLHLSHGSRPFPHLVPHLVPPLALALSLLLNPPPRSSSPWFPSCSSSGSSPSSPACFPPLSSPKTLHSSSLPCSIAPPLPAKPSSSFSCFSFPSSPTSDSEDDHWTVVPNDHPLKITLRRLPRAGPSNQPKAPKIHPPKPRQLGPAPKWIGNLKKMMVQVGSRWRKRAAVSLQVSAFMFEFNLFRFLSISFSLNWLESVYFNLHELL